MNPIIIVIPILTILMFELGLTLRLSDFKALKDRPLPVIVGLIGQILILPVIAFAVAYLFKLDALFFIGVMLIACSPGGSSSNVFSLLAGGDVALSVMLTGLSSVITLFTIPIVMAFTTSYINFADTTVVQLPIAKLIVQNIVLMLLPILLGVLSRKYLPKFASIAYKVLGKIAFPALLVLAGIFFVQHYNTIVAEFAELGACVTVFMICAILISLAIAKIFNLKKKERKTIIFEVGMQNAASAIAIASSPFIFNNDIIAIPAIIYALVMNIVLLTYLQFAKKSQA